MTTALFKTITASEINQKIVAKQADAIIKITTTWSGASRIISSQLEELVTLHQHDILLFLIDHDQDASISTLYDINTFPTVLFFKEGVLIDKISGIVPKGLLSSRIQQIITKS